MDSVSSSLGIKVLFSTTSLIVFMCLVEPVLPRGKFDICVKFDPELHSFRTFHDRSYTSLLPLISLVGLPGSLGDNHHCDDSSHHHYDDVEGTCCDELRHLVDTG